MTQRQDCARRGGTVDEEKVVVRKGNLTLAWTSGKIERSADAFPVRHHRTSWEQVGSHIRKPTGDCGTKNDGSGKNWIWTEGKPCLRASDHCWLPVRQKDFPRGPNSLACFVHVVCAHAKGRQASLFFVLPKECYLCVVLLDT